MFFSVAYGAMIQMLVPREDYVAANSLVHGSRAFSFLAGNSVGGVLVQLLRGPSLIPPALRSRVSGAFNVVNYGVRPLGTASGGVLGSLIGLRPTLWIATVGALGGLLFILPSPIVGLRALPEEAP